MDERLRSFKANLNFFCNWEELSGRPWKEFDPASERDCRLAIYCGLKDEVEGITLVECGRMIDTSNNTESWQHILGVISASQGGGAKNPQEGGGSSNGPSPGSPSA